MHSSCRDLSEVDLLGGADNECMASTFQTDSLLATVEAGIAGENTHADTEGKRDSPLGHLLQRVPIILDALGDHIPGATWDEVHLQVRVARSLLLAGREDIARAGLMAMIDELLVWAQQYLTPLQAQALRMSFAPASSVDS